LKLREALTAFAADWRDDLSPAWQHFLTDVQPDVASVAERLTFSVGEPIFPARLRTPLVAARGDAHVFRAFDDLAPAEVRCVLIGQDPYPKSSRATGRSFEQGDLESWSVPASKVAASLRNLVRMLIAARIGVGAFQGGSWRALIERAAMADINLEPPRQLFDRLQIEEGVLFLNAGLTLTRYKSGGAPEQTQGHIPFWKPVVGRVLRTLSSRGNGHVVFLCLGGFAQQLVVREGVQAAAMAAGAWQTRVRVLTLPHPVAPGFTTGANPFVAVNEQLEAMGAARILW
jgi:uracil-DNA glycosylase